MIFLQDILNFHNMHTLSNEICMGERLIYQRSCCSNNIIMHLLLMKISYVLTDESVSGINKYQW